MQIGVLGSSTACHVRAGARVEATLADTRGKRYTLGMGWWVMPGDRWRDPAVEIVSRQSLIRDLPIYSLAMPVPSGDAVINNYVTIQGPRELAVTDIDNRSKVPFAAALIVTGEDLSLSGRVVSSGGQAVVHLGLTPHSCVVAESLDGLWNALAQGDTAPGTVETKMAGSGAMALLFAVTHKSSVRAAAVIAVSSPVAYAGNPLLDALPKVHDIANGWDLQLERGVTFKNSNEPVSDGNQTKYRTLAAVALLKSGPAIDQGASGSLLERAALARALATAGYLQESSQIVDDLRTRQNWRGAFVDDNPGVAPDMQAMSTALVVDAICRHVSLSHDAVLAEAAAPAMAGALEYVAKAMRKGEIGPFAASAAACAQWFFKTARDPDAAKQVAKLFAGASPEPFVLPAEMVPVAAMSKGATFVPESTLGLAEAMFGYLSGLVAYSGETVYLLAGFSNAHLGLPLEMRNVVTPFGRLSFVVRWHGERPALLWDCVATHDDQRCDDLRLELPRFANHVLVGARGEALLPVPVPET